jgi:hypothetical protein
MKIYVWNYVEDCLRWICCQLISSLDELQRDLYSSSEKMNEKRRKKLRIYFEIFVFHINNLYFSTIKSIQKKCFAS